MLTEADRHRAAEEILRAERERKGDPTAQQNLSENGDRRRLSGPGILG